MAEPARGPAESRSPGGRVGIVRVLTGLPSRIRYADLIGHRVVILGGGFGGLYAAKALRKTPADVTLLDKRNYHLFQPLMYQVATGSLSPANIAAPLRGILRGQGNVKVLLAEATDIDPRARRLSLADGGDCEYDSLIVSTGSETNYFGQDAWRKWAPSLKSVEEATAIRHKILYAFEAAERIADPDERSAWLTFVIVGGGATGVELAGALGEIANHTLKRDFRAIRPEEARILLLDGSDRLLPSYHPALSARAERALLRLGVRVRSGVRVTAVDAEGVAFEGPEGAPVRYAARTVLWAGGVTVSSFGRTLAERTSAPVDRTGRILVNPDLTIPGFPDIYVAGDLAAITGPDGEALPGVAQVAMQSGAYAARSISRRLTRRNAPGPFHYFDKGELAVIGRGSAVADIFGLRISGVVAWLVWLFIHLMYLVQFQSRVVVFVEWGFHYLTFSRAARLITGNLEPERPRAGVSPGDASSMPR